MDSGTPDKEPENTLIDINLNRNIDVCNENLKEKNLNSMKRYLSTNSGFVKVTEDELILKKINFKGYGKCNPSDGEDTFVNYVAELEDGRSVDNSLILREPKKIMMGENHCVPGLEIGIKSMIMGEKAKIVVFPGYGYLLQEFKSKKNKDEDKSEFNYINHLEKLNFKEIDYPSIEEFNKMELKDQKKYLPIIYNIELVKIDKPRKNREDSDVTEKMTEASDLKIEGNQLFRENRYREALIKYSTGINYFFKIPTEDLKTIKLIDLKHTLILNIINCHLALNEYNYALKRINEAFEIKETPKCYFYRALSSMNLDDFEQAEKDLDKLKNLLPNDKQVLGLEGDLKRLKNKTINEKKNIFKKGLFMQSSENNSYNENKKPETILPCFNEKNFCFYLDYLLNNNYESPQKIKIEIFNSFSQRKLNENQNNLVNCLIDIIKARKLKDKEIEIKYQNEDGKSFAFNLLELEESDKETFDIYEFLNIKKGDNSKKFPPCEDLLLAIKKNKNLKYDLIILPFNLGDNPIEDIFIIGRVFFNKENFSSISNRIEKGEIINIKITECDCSLNI